MLLMNCFLIISVTFAIFERLLKSKMARGMTWYISGLEIWRVRSDRTRGSYPLQQLAGTITIVPSIILFARSCFVNRASCAKIARANRGKFRKKILKKKFFEKIFSKKFFFEKIFSKKFRESCAQIVNRARQIVNRTRTKHEARSTKSDRPRHDRPRARNPIVYEARSSPPRQSWRVRRIRSVGSATESLFRGLYNNIYAFLP